MTPSEQHRLGTILISVVADLGARYWSDDSRAFARAADRLAKEGNELAARFWVANTMVGADSHEFREMVSMLHFSALISHNSQHWDRMYLEVSPRVTRHLIERAGATPQELEDARALMLAHWQEAYGQPWEAPLS